MRVHYRIEGVTNVVTCHGKDMQLPIALMTTDDLDKVTCIDCMRVVAKDTSGIMKPIDTEVSK